MDFEPISKHWNRIDTLIYKIEKIISSLIDHWKESGDTEPDIEEIIAAETQHLRTENEEYKKMRYPLDLIVRDGNTYCPECDTKIPEEYQGKCCFECGQRIKRKSASDKRYYLDRVIQNTDDCNGIH